MTMPERSRHANRTEVGRFVRKMIRVLAAQHEWSMDRTLTHLSEQLSYSPDAIRRWMSGAHLPGYETIEKLVRIGATKARMDKSWAEQTLFHANHPNRIRILADLFPSETPQVRHNLPRFRYPVLGRDEEINRIIELLDPKARDWIVPIEGVGGIGKSALALEIGEYFVEAYDRLPPAQRFHAIIWISAKRQELTPTGINPILPTLTNIDDIYAGIADVLTAPKILQLSGNEQQREVMQTLRASGRVLLIVDNLETVIDPALTAVLYFLREIPNNVKAIVTTREHENLPFPLRLDTLNVPAATNLVTRECFALGVQLTSEQVNQLLKATGRLPLALWLAVGLISLNRESIDTILAQLTDHQGGLLRYVFATVVGELKNTDQDAYQVLLALSFFDADAGATGAALANILELDPEVCNRALQRLLNLSLANRNKTQERFRLLPLTRAYALAELSQDPSREQALREQWIASFFRLIIPTYDDDNYDILQYEIGNVWEIMEWLITHNRMDDLGRMYRYVHPFLYAKGSYWDILMRYAERLAAWGVEQQRADIVGLTLHSPIDISRKRNEQILGERWLERANLLALQLQDEVLRGEVLFARGHLWDRFNVGTQDKLDTALANESARAREDLEQALEIFKRHDPKRMTQVFNALGSFYRWRTEYDRAIEYYQAGLLALNTHPPIAPTWRGIGPVYWRAILNGNLALIAGGQGKFDEAIAGLIEIMPDLRDEVDRAEVFAARALYALKQRQIDEALTFHAEAERIKATHGISQPISVEDARWDETLKQCRESSDS